MNPKISEIEEFLINFKQKLKVYNVFFKHREKNLQTLLDLEITPKERENYLLKLEPIDYCDGPIPDAFDPESPPNYEFGIIIKNKEIYIKINMGKPEKSVMCISFHVAEHKMHYPFKQEKKNEEND